MKPITDNFSINIVGNWNVGLFTPQWAKANLFGGTAPEVELALLANGFATRLRCPPVFVFPNPSRLSIGVLSNPMAEWERALGIAESLASTLKHTPVTAVGFNCGFLVDEANEKLKALFQLSDDLELAKKGAEIKETEIKRALSLDGLLLNLSVVMHDNGEVVFDFNYHYSVESMEGVAEAVEVSKNKDLVSKSLDLLDSVWELPLGDAKEAENAG